MVIKEGTFIPSFVLHLRDKRGLKPKTIKQYSWICTHFLQEGYDIRNLENVRDFMLEWGAKVPSARPGAALKQLAMYQIPERAAVNEVKRNIDACAIGRVKPKKYINKKPLDDEQVRAVINALELHMHKVIATIMYYTGFRVGDVLNLRRGGVFYTMYEGMYCLRLGSLTKGDDRQIKFIWDAKPAKYVFDYVNCIQDPEEYIFLKKKRRLKVTFFDEQAMMKENTFNYFAHKLQEACRKCHVEPGRFSSHDFRRLFARRVWEKFHDIHILQHLLGHATYETSLRYLETEGINVAKYTKELFFDSMKPKDL